MKITNNEEYASAKLRMSELTDEIDSLATEIDAYRRLRWRKMSREMFKEWLMGLEKFTKAQARKAYQELQARHNDNITGDWEETDNPTIEIQMNVSYA